MTLVREFHEAFGLPIKDGPTIPYLDRVRLRRRLITEEFTEVMEEFDRIESRLERGAYNSVRMVLDDVARLAKELSDLRVVGEGTELEFGIPGDAVYAEVHRSNMSKLGPDGRPIRRHDGKVLKGPNYEEANVLLVLGVVEGSVE